MGQSSKSSLPKNCGLWTCSTAIPGACGKCRHSDLTTASLGPSWHFSVTPDICASESLGRVPHSRPAGSELAPSVTPGTCVASVRAWRAWGGPHPGQVRIAGSVTESCWG